MYEEFAYNNNLTNAVRQTKEIIRFFAKKWLLLVIALVFGVLLGVVYYKFQKPNYKATCTFILEDKSSGGNLAGLASQFGLNLGGLTGGGSIFSGDNILQILQSKKVVQQVLLSSADPSHQNNKSLSDLYLEFSGLKEKWNKKKPFLASVNFNIGKKQLTPLEDSVLSVIYEKVVEKNLSIERSSKQSTIIKVQVKAENALFARLMTERLVEEAGKLYLDIRTGSAQENIRKMQRRSDSLLLILNNKTFKAASAQLLDINPGIKTAVAPVEIAMRDKTVAATLYTEVTKNLEASKLLLSQQTPVIQLLDVPPMLLKNDKLELVLLIILFSFLSEFLIISYLVLLFFLRKYLVVK